jgi:hypothetical protein
MTLNKIINVVLLVAVVYFGWTYVIPWFKSLGSGPGSRIYAEVGTGEEAKCVTAARDAAESFSEELKSFAKPPIDTDKWDRTWLRIENRISKADDVCGCGRPGCLTAQGALGNLRDLGSDFDNAARGGGAPPVNAASTMNRVYDALDMAAQQSRGIRDE